MDDTIVAISTATGNGGIGIIRMSGENCFKILNKIFVPKSKDNQVKGYSIKYGNIFNIEKEEVVDEVLVSYFIAPKSYTRENMCEINTHGGMIVEKKILELCTKNGAILATPGEFTKRAFLNGRIDLSQAEAIANLINSKTEKEAKESINQLEGALSNKIGEIEQKLLDIMVSIEVTIDYPEYDIDEVANIDELNDLMNVKCQLEKLFKSFNQGKIIRDGIKTVILGKPNVGKSSLLNAILKEDRAIVSSIEGTTRDTIEEFVNINGILLKLIDTAGIRKADNEIEKIGVDRSLKLSSEADLIIAIFDISNNLDSEDERILKIIKDKTAIVALNKVDINRENQDLESKIAKIKKPIIKISALESNGLEELYKNIERMFEISEIKSENTVLITEERHKNQIDKAIKDVEKSIDTIKNNVPVDISTIYIKQALEDLGEITGKNVSEDVINEIFKKFCLGK